MRPDGAGRVRIQRRTTSLRNFGTLNSLPPECDYAAEKNPALHLYPYRSIAKPPIGDADHNTVHLVPIYKSLLKLSAKCVERQVKVWNEDSTARLQGCFDCTDWDVFRNSCSSLDELTDVVTSYVSFCVDTVIPVKKCKVFPITNLGYPSN